MARRPAAHAAYNARMAAVGFEVGPHEGDWWQAIRFPLNEGCRSMTMDGQTAVGKLMVEAGDGDIGSLRWSIEPHSFVHATADFLFMFSAMPLTPKETLIISKWLVHKDAGRGRRLRPRPPDASSGTAPTSRTWPWWRTTSRASNFAGLHARPLLRRRRGADHALHRLVLRHRPRLSGGLSWPRTEAARAASRHPRRRLRL